MWGSAILTLLLASVVTCAPVNRCPPAVKAPYSGSSPGPFIADDSNPSVYYECIDGQAYKSFCGQGLYFDAARSSCVKETPYYGNRPVFTFTPPTASPEFEGSDDQDQDQGRLPSYPDGKGKGRCLGICPTDFPHTPARHLPHESDCTLFCKCDHGKPVLFFCPDGLYFNPILEVCDWPSHSRCNNGHAQKL